MTIAHLFGTDVEGICMVCDHVLNIAIGSKGWYTNKISVQGMIDSVLYCRCAVCKAKNYAHESFELSGTYDITQTHAHRLFWDDLLALKEETLLPYQKKALHEYRFRKQLISDGRLHGHWDGIENHLFVDAILFWSSWKNKTLKALHRYMPFFINSLISTGLHEYLHFYFCENFLDEYWHLLNMEETGSLEDERICTVLTRLLLGDYADQGTAELTIAIRDADEYVSYLRGHGIYKEKKEEELSSA